MCARDANVMRARDRDLMDENVHDQAQFHLFLVARTATAQSLINLFYQHLLINIKLRLESRLSAVTFATFSIYTNIL